MDEHTQDMITWKTIKADYPAIGNQRCRDIVKSLPGALPSTDGLCPRISAPRESYDEWQRQRREAYAEQRRENERKIEAHKRAEQVLRDAKIRERARRDAERHGVLTTAHKGGRKRKEMGTC